ncbi:polysaccharide pyruvyl transferase family protein, partial [Arthrospira platensis SPKY2]
MNHTNLVQVLEQTPIEIYVFGAGMQDKLPPDLSILSKSTQELLKLFDAKARLFAVRGEYTKNWLQAVGFKNTQLLGCPSMYVYPLSVINSQKVVSISGNKVLTAGHISKKNLMGVASKAKRAIGLVEIFQGFSPSYVFQDEPFTYDELFDVPCIYSDATSQFDSGKITEYISGLCKQEIPFQSYYMFHETGAWRQVCQKYDIYIGDRFHGG